jgi:hypothetical protein
MLIVLSYFLQLLVCAAVQVALIMVVLFSAERISWELQAKRTTSTVRR